MSIFTERETSKSLWHPITDDDYNIDFSKPVMLFTDEGGIILVEGIDDMNDYIDDETYFDRKAQSLTDSGKEYFRGYYYAYMYIDEDFFKAITPTEPWPWHRSIGDVKGTAERPYLFIMYENGDMLALSHFDFDMNGSIDEKKYSTSPYWQDCEGCRNNSPIKYVVNLDHCLQTTLSAIFLQPIEPLSKVYVVTSGDYSDYHIDGVFTTEANANLFAEKDSARGIEEFDTDEERLLQQKHWWKVYIELSLESKVGTASVYSIGNWHWDECFDTVSFSQGDNKNPTFCLTVAANKKEKARAIALERFHALLAVEETHFPLLRKVLLKDKDLYHVYQNSFVFGYFDYKIYVNDTGRLQDVFMKVKSQLPKPLTEEEEDEIDWQNLTEDYCLELMSKHGLNLEQRDVAFLV